MYKTKPLRLDNGFHSHEKCYNMVNAGKCKLCEPIKVEQHPRYHFLEQNSKQFCHSASKNGRMHSHGKPSQFDVTTPSHVKYWLVSQIRFETISQKTDRERQFGRNHEKKED
jgi:hypothetical protein